MKVLLFSHKNDIDGMGSVILSKLAFEEVDYILCGTFELQVNVKDLICNKKIYEYDKIYITDLCLETDLLSLISNDKKLKEKIQVIDHHKTYDNPKYTKYNFVNIKIKDDKGLCCGTSLFYEYLINKNYLIKNKTIDEFVELTRLHDTWEWKNIYNCEKARELAILFDILGIKSYISFMYHKLKNDDSFTFTEMEKILINNKKLEIKDAINNYLPKIYYRDILNLKAGILFIDYQYRNEIAEYLRENNYDMDFVMMISLDRGVVSYRSIKDNVSVLKVAEFFNGKGHNVAATNPITTDKEKEIIKILINK